MTKRKETAVGHPAPAGYERLTAQFQTLAVAHRRGPRHAVAAAEALSTADLHSLSKYLYKLCGEMRAIEMFVDRQLNKRYRAQCEAAAKEGGGA